MDYKIGDLTKEEAIYIGEKINEIVPGEVDAEVEEFVLKVRTKMARSLADASRRHTNTTGREFCLKSFGWMNAIAIRGSAL